MTANYIVRQVAISAPDGTNPILPNADGSLNVSGTISASSAAAATAADPSYSEGTSQSFSQTLAGYLRVLVKGKGTAGSADTGVVTVQGIASMTPVQVSQAVAANLNATVVGTGTFAVQAAQSGTWNVGTVTTITNVVHVDDNSGSLTVDAAGQTASGSSLTANPVTAGGLAKTANPTAVTDGQVVNSLHDKLGKQVVVSALRDLKGTQKTTITSSTGETTIITAVASTFLDLYQLIIANTSATACNVTIKDDTAGTTRFIVAVPAGQTVGFNVDCGSAVPQSAVNKNWTATCSASVASIEITAGYVKNT